MAESMKTKTSTATTQTMCEQPVLNFWGLSARLISSSEKLPQDKHFTVIMSAIIGLFGTLVLGALLFGILTWYGKASPLINAVLPTIGSGITAAVVARKCSKQPKASGALSVED